MKRRGPLTREDQRLAHRDRLARLRGRIADKRFAAACLARGIDVDEALAIGPLFALEMAEAVKGNEGQK